MEEDCQKAVYDTIPDIKVPKKCCKDCFLFPSGPLSKDEEQELVSDLKDTNRPLECIAITIARRCGHIMTEYVCCYGVFYNHNQEIPILKKAIEEGKVEFIDLGNELPSLATTGFTLWAGKDGKKWQ